MQTYRQRNRLQVRELDVGDPLAPLRVPVRDQFHVLDFPHSRKELLEIAGPDLLGQLHAKHGPLVAVVRGNRW